MSSGGPYRVGQRFGPYTLDAYLGAGAFKSVYRARNEGASVEDRVVALGFPHQQDPEGIAEIEKEFAVTSRLIHPNILRVFSLERHEGVVFLVMEYLDGKNLRMCLRERNFFPLDEAVRYAGLISEALEYAHSARVFHRDVKPENIFITANNTPKLLDFGVARILARTSEKASTRIGTVEYMAPEALQGASGTNADLWALGVTLYELLTGERPFTGEVGDVINKIMSARYSETPLQQKRVDNRVVRVLRKLLHKDPESRYQLAGELARDLESVARRTRMIDDDESRLGVLIRASFPIISVYSFEENRVLDAVRRIAQQRSDDMRRPRRVYVWSTSRGLRDEEDQLVSKDTLEDPTGALAHVIENTADAIYVFLDMHHHYTPVTTRLIRDAARAVRLSRKSVIFLSPFFHVPDELQKEISLAVFHLPDRQHLEPLIDAVVEEVKLAGMPVSLDEPQRQALVRAALGLTLAEAERAIRAGVLRMGGLVPGVERTVVEEKTQLIRKTGILEYYHSSDSFKDVGGMSRLLAWFNARLPVFSGAARYAGLPQPKGVMLVGVPGCGKSLSARALAGAWGVPLLRLDVGRIFGSIFGTSEANLRRAIQTAEAVSPCILWIDEVEKGFAGVRGQGSGGAVAARVFGAFLSWLQDKRSPVFVVATANDLSGIPPEFLRQGRFDDIFFVGLPGKQEREAIFKIHLNKRRRDPKGFDLAALTNKSDGFSGAEIEQAIVTGLFEAFEKQRDVETPDVIAALESTHPLSKSRAREIQAITTWASRNAKAAN